MKLPPHSLRDALTAAGASPLAVAWRCDQDPLRLAFLRGAEAMRARILLGIRRWWEAARNPKRPHTWPGHPHWLEGLVRKIETVQLPAGGGAGGFDGGAQAPHVDRQGLGELRHGSDAGGLPGATAQAQECLGVDLGPLGQRPERQAGGVDQVVQGLGASHGVEPLPETPERIHQPALDFFRETPDSSLTQQEPPTAAHLLRGEQRPGASPEPESKTMTTLPAALSADQQLAIAVHRSVGTEPIFSPSPELVADLTAKLGRDPLRDRYGYTASFAGIEFILHPEQLARVDDVAEFLANYGPPCTHDRARQIVFEECGDEYLEVWQDMVADVRIGRL